MKHIFNFICISLLFVAELSFAQAPEKMSYQAVVRDGSDNLIKSTSIGMQISILQGSASGSAVYTERHFPTTNTNGLASIEIGNGTVVSGNFMAIDWASGPHFIKTETDPNGGTAYSISGTAPLLSVPYALYAEKAATVDGLPATFDTDSTNELQTITFNPLSGELTISDGNTITLPLATGGDNWGSQVVVSDATLSGNGTAGNPLTINGVLTDNQTLSLSSNTLAISNGNSVDLSSFQNTDNQTLSLSGALLSISNSNNVNLSAINTDNQTLSVSGSNLTISGGNTITIPTGTGGDNWGAQVVISDATLTGNGTNANPLRIAPQGATSGQVLKWNGSAWLPAADAMTIDTSHWDKSSNYIFTRNDSIGIGLFRTIGNIFPKARLHVDRGDVIFGTGDFLVEFQGQLLPTQDTTQLKWHQTLGALRLGRVYNPVISEYVAPGKYSFSSGDRSQASGIAATAFGKLSFAQGENSFAAGDSAVATNLGSVALGYKSNSSGFGSFTAGIESRASGRGSAAVGNKSIASGSESIAMGANSTASGSESIAIHRSVASGAGSIAISGGNATGDGSLAILYGTASNLYSIAIGDNALSSGRGSFALGQDVSSSGFNSFALGDNSSASGNSSFALGTGNIVRSRSETVIGQYNSDYIPTGGANTWNTADRLFVIGNGITNTSRSSALMVLKNGKTAIGNITPQTNLHIYHGTINAGSPPLQGLRLENSGTSNNYWTIYTVNSTGTMALYSKDGGNSAVGSFNPGTGAYSNTSNRHLKTDISSLDENTLSKVMELEPARYRYIRDTKNQFTLGLIAEDVKPLFPELVETIGEDGKSMAINYAGFSIVAIKAIQEQQKMIEQLKKEIEQLKSIVIK